VTFINFVLDPLPPAPDPAPRKKEVNKITSTKFYFIFSLFSKRVSSPPIPPLPTPPYPYKYAI
jgi:hypothetical protein